MYKDMPVRIIPPPVRTFHKNGRPLAPKKRSDSTTLPTITVNGKKRGRPRRRGDQITMAIDPSSHMVTVPTVSVAHLSDRRKNSLSGQSHTDKRVLMFGWELPPFNSGGLGVASYGLAQALAQQGAQITFVLPRRVDIKVPFMKLVFASDIPFTKEQRENFGAYAGVAVSKKIPGMRRTVQAEGSLLSEVIAYARRAARIAREEPHDIIHAHDWLSFPAGMVSMSLSHAPMVAHVHATEYDRSGDQVNQTVSMIEQEGCERADRVIAVSDFTRHQIVNHYHVPESRVDVVYNGVQTALPLVQSTLTSLKKSGKKIVLFVGRITLQKGPDYFLQAAAQVAAHEPQAMFLVAGSGDMERAMIMMAARLGISDRMLFVGFLRDRELASVYRTADVFVMPSVSEPFGIAALESMAYRTPVIVSKQSGVAELVRNALKVDFWDTREMAHKILAVLRYQSLQKSLSQFGADEVQAYTWERAAQECLRVYEKLM